MRSRHEETPMPWSIAQAKQRFSELVRQAAEAPQLIYNRERLVAAVIDAKEYRAFKDWSEQTAARDLAGELAELREIMREEGYELELPPRSTRSSGFLETLEDEGRGLSR
jgi:prevent-host-death family protein